jgi:hypothetical protein
MRKEKCLRLGSESFLSYSDRDDRLNIWYQTMNTAFHKKWLTALSVIALLLACRSGTAAGDILIADFEQGRESQQKDSGGQWRFDGTTYVLDAEQLSVSGLQGKRFLSSIAPQKAWASKSIKPGPLIDLGTGRAGSPEFTIARKYIKFLISGGRYPGRASLNLVVDGAVVRSATGDFSTAMKAVSFDVSAYAGRRARIEVVDVTNHLSGHVCVDNIIQSDQPAPRVISTLPQAPVVDGTVHTTGVPLSGGLDVSDGQLSVNGRTVPLEDIVCVDFRKGLKKYGPTPFVRLVNGEILRAGFVSGKPGKLNIEGPLIGKHEVDTKAVACLDFTPRADGGSFNRSGILYREAGDPVAGTVVSIGTDSLAFESRFGMLEIPRAGLACYRFVTEEDITWDGETDEIALVDGSMLRGTVALAGKSLVITHPVLKSVSVDWNLVRSIRRTRPDVVWLSQVNDVKTELKGALYPPPPPHEVGPGGEENSVSPGTIRVSAETVASYKLPFSGSRRKLCAVLMPEPGCRGDVDISVEVSGRSLFNKALESDAEPQALALELPAGDALTIRVEFGGRIAYPCGADLGNAYVVKGQ